MGLSQEEEELDWCPSLHWSVECELLSVHQTHQHLCVLTGAWSQHLLMSVGVACHYTPIVIFETGMSQRCCGWDCQCLNHSLSILQRVEHRLKLSAESQLVSCFLNQLASTGHPLH